jgi:ABC-type branched-subunit amino acid transport system permease subunit
VLGWNLKVPAGTADIVLGTLMAAILILRPQGITGGREFSLPRRRRAVADLEKARVST